LLLHVDAVAGGAIAHDALDVPRDICPAMCMSSARGFVIMSCFLFLTGSGKFGSSSDNSVRIWDVNTQQQVAVLTGHTSTVTSIAFDVSGKYLASGDLTMMMT
jgi:WD40 repeat protein